MKLFQDKTFAIRGIFEGTDLAVLAHLKDTVSLRGAYIINGYCTK